MDPRATDRAGAAAQALIPRVEEGLLAGMGFDLTPYHPLVMGDHAGDGFEHEQRRRERGVIGRGESGRGACRDQDRRAIQLGRDCRWHVDWSRGPLTGLTPIPRVAPLLTF